MRIGFHFLLMIFVAILSSVGLSYFSLTDGGLFGVYRLDSWTAWPQVGSPTPDPYTRAFVARSGALQLGSGEGIQFVATRDSRGDILHRNCNYRIAGSTPVASFWTLRAAATDGSGITPKGSRQNMHSSRLVRSNDGAAVIYVGSKLSPGNWLEIEGEGAFDLILTFYDASVFAGFSSSVAALPWISRESCS